MKSVLIVENREDVRQMIVVMLIRSGFEGNIETATDGTQALQIMKNLQPDEVKLILCDLEMSPMNGIDFREHLLSSNRAWIKVPFYVITGRGDLLADNDFKPLKEKLRITGVFKKPLKAGDFSAILQIVNADDTNPAAP